MENFADPDTASVTKNDIEIVAVTVHLLLIKNKYTRTRYRELTYNYIENVTCRQDIDVDVDNVDGCMCCYVIDLCC